MIQLWQVDAFVTDAPFSGNPAAVCVLREPRPDAWMRGVALEMNLSETAFLAGRPDGAWDLRWFTPAVEVDLCGHATLASAHTLWTELGVEGELRFHTRSGALEARRAGERIELDFPATPTPTVEAPPGVLAALGVAAPVAVTKSRFDFLIQLPSREDVESLRPDFAALRSLGTRGVIVTAADDRAGDIVSRFFAPGAGIDEDPVTGSAHCALAPFWAPRLGKTTLTASQASARGGALEVELVGDRVKLRGRARTALRGELLL